MRPSMILKSARRPAYPARGSPDRLRSRDPAVPHTGQNSDTLFLSVDRSFFGVRHTDAPLGRGWQDNVELARSFLFRDRPVGCAMRAIRKTRPLAKGDG